jgi:hypothetical protein
MIRVESTVFPPPFFVHHTFFRRFKVEIEVAAFQREAQQALDTTTASARVSPRVSPLTKALPQASVQGAAARAVPVGAAAAAASISDAARGKARARDGPSSSALPPAPVGSGGGPQSPPQPQPQPPVPDAARRPSSLAGSHTAAAYTSGGQLAKLTRSSSRGSLGGNSRRGSGSIISGSIISSSSNGDVAARANGGKIDELRAAMKETGGERLEGRPGGGSFPQRTLPQIPPIGGSSGGSGSGGGVVSGVGGGGGGRRPSSDNALVPAGNPRPGSRQMIDALRAQGLAQGGLGMQLLPLARVTPRALSGRRGSLGAR